jgi:uncharacterized glyoxalase superfamily protein PhnB
MLLPSHHHQEDAQEDAMDKKAEKKAPKKAKIAPAGSVAIPCLRYRETSDAIDWLSEVFGFACQVAVPGIDGAIAHAQLTLGNGMIMIGSVSSEGEYGRLLAQPDEIGGRETHTVYLVVNDVDRICERARAAGAVILEEPADTEFGSRGFLCRDPEGHVWNVGSYDPWQPEDLFNQAGGRRP